MPVRALNSPMRSYSAFLTGIVVGDRGLEAGKLEYRGRRDAESTEFAADNAITFIRSRMVR